MAKNLFTHLGEYTALLRAWLRGGSQGTGVSRSGGRQAWPQHSSLVSPLSPMLLPPADDVSVLLQEIITEARNLSNAEM